MLNRESSVDDVFKYIEDPQVGGPLKVVLFVDQGDLCTQYTNVSQRWLSMENIPVVEVCGHIQETFQIGKVPQMRFWFAGSEIYDEVGKITYQEYLEIKRDLLGKINLTSEQRRKLSLEVVT